MARVFAESETDEIEASEAIRNARSVAQILYATDALKHHDCIRSTMDS